MLDAAVLCCDNHRSTVGRLVFVVGSSISGIACLSRLAAVLVPLVAAACTTTATEPETSRHTVALAESPEITLTVVNDQDRAVRFVGPLGNTFDVLAGESLSLRLVVVALADFEENVFRDWLVPAGPVAHRLVELDAPSLVDTDGLTGRLSYVLADARLGTLHLTAQRCSGEGWRRPGLGAAEFKVRLGSLPAAPLVLCPGNAD
jgi:hypothetical protein